MAVRPIRVFGDPVLKSVSAPIGEIDDGVRALVKDLIDTVELPGRAGVAACQIGVVLVETSGDPQPIGEGCLSVPGLWHDAIRYPYAKVVGIDLDGNEIVVEGEGLLAQALQHETDHLDGMLYLDRLTPEERRVAMREIRESDWF
jgi:peptide deformylase